MPLKKLIIVFIVLAAAGGGVYYYLTNIHQKTVDPWQMVPSSAIMAYENRSLINNWNNVLEKDVWQTLRQMPFFEAWQENLANADSLSGKSGALDRLFRDVDPQI